MLGLGKKSGERATAADVVARARALPADDHGRWRVLAELDGLDIKVVFDTATELIGAGDQDSAVLGAQILDGVFSGRLQARRFALAGAQLLEPLCAPDQDPMVLATALYPYTTLCAVTDPLLFELLEHPDPRVRSAACRVIAPDQEAAEDSRIIEALVRVLGQDPNDDVRGNAAESLLITYSTDERYKPQIADALAPYGNDPHAVIRVAAIQAISDDDAERILARLTAELQDPQADWRFVRACDGRGFWEAASYDTRADARQALLQLAERNWSARETPGQYPFADERAEMLAEAIEAVTPEADVSRLRADNGRHAR